MLKDEFQGPRNAKLKGAYIERDWDKVGAGDWYSSDDFTPEVYFYIPDADGFTLTRGQWLPMIDERSKRILDFILVPEKHYTAINIRTLINKVCLRYGMPRYGFTFECGIWKKSTLVGGAVPYGEMKMNFAERLGLRIEHALPGNAKAKIVENIGKLFQRRMRGEPGWVGSNEQTVKYEHVQRAKLNVQAKRLHPADAGFYSFEQYFRRMSELCDEYNQSLQDSKVMGGRFSPDEAWRLLQTRNEAGQVIELVDLPPDARYLLATDRRRVRIGRNGITLPKSLGGGTYRNEITGRLGRIEVNVYFDPAMPETVSIVSDDRSLVYTIPLAPTCPAHNATPEEIATAQASVNAHSSYARQRVSEIRSEYMPPKRRLMAVDPETSAVGREIKAQQVASRIKQQTQQKARKQIAAAARTIGITPGAVKDPRALELLKKGLADA